jgi:nucleotidyltransferase AbiEii toxin of type IV toxin-antitoxin system
VTRTVTDFAASPRARLLTATHAGKGDFQLTLQRYAAERFLYRLGVSPYRDRFVLRGPMLFVLWDDSASRPTKDLDLAGYPAGDAESLAAAFREICSIPYPRDGVHFALDTVEIDAIVPEPVDAVYPVLLDADPPRIRAYPREAVVAEKLHAMVLCKTER